MEQRGRTLFVRNLPFTTTNEQLEAAFSNIGPVQRCFVVADKGAEISRGFGYVTFASREDAGTASKKVTVVEGRRVHVHFAKRKPPKLDKKKDADLPYDGDDNIDEPKDTAEEDSAKVNKDSDAKKDARKKRHIMLQDTDSGLSDKKLRWASLSLVLSGFADGTTEEDVKKLISSQPKAEDVQFPVPEREVPTALVQFKARRFAVKAMKRLQGHKLQGKKLETCLLSTELLKAKKSAPSTNPKKARLIIRNLAFCMTEKSLKAHCSKFGEVTDVQVPLTTGGNKKGFGFVQFDNLKTATDALAKLNGSLIGGRPVVVDWAVSKDRFQSQKEAKKSEPVKLPEDSDDSGPYSSVEDEKQVAGMQDDQEDNSSSDDSSDEDDDDDDDEEDVGRDASVDDENDDEEDSTSDTSDDDDDDDDDDGASDEGFDSDKDQKKNKQRRRKSDLDQGRTLFIRNISFQSEEESVEEAFSQFGELEYCRLVIDPQTEHPRGTGFIKFKKKDDADKCIAATSDEKSEGVTVDGRRLYVSLAISREEAEEKRKTDKEKKKAKPDNRNLYLAREGMIRAGTQAAEGLSKADLDMRAKVDQIKREKLKNPNIFVSATRLCIRNIPVRVTDKELKKVFLKSAGEKSAKITECRVMRDLSQVNTKGVAKSRGYGFIDFTDHKHAIVALRHTNNNPDIFGEKKRLIVEFSLENKSALEARKRRKERHQTKKAQLARQGTTENSSSSGKPRKSAKKPTVTLAPRSEDNVGKKGQKALPSHWGAKVRHKKKSSSQKKEKPKSEKISRTEKKKRKAEVDQEIQPSTKRRKRSKGEKTDKLDKVIHKHQKRTAKNSASSSKQKSKKAKWFQS